MAKAKWPGFISPQLALLVDSPPEESNYIHEIKFDGYRLQTQIKNGKAKLLTRHGHDWSEKFPTLIKALNGLKLNNAIFDGEAVVLDSKGRSHFSLLQEALSNNDDSKILIYLFDLFYLDGEDLRELPLSERKEKLKNIIPNNHSVIRFTEDVKKDAEGFYKLACLHNLEGIISKDSSAPYFKGRSQLWLKSKCTKRQELIIGGFTTGKGSRGAELGALLLGVNEKNKFRYVGKVGTGFNQQMLKKLKSKVEKLERKKSAFDINIPKGKNIHWIKPELVAEVSFTEWTREGSLRHPVFLGLREDKEANEVLKEETHHDEEVILSHPKKVLFLKEKITKTDIANYYEQVEKWILPHISNRPLSLLRCPNGTSRQCFYQKHPQMMDVEKFFKTFKVKEETKTTIQMALDSKVGLKQVVQMNAFEIHVWNCHYDQLMYPDQIVIDFDPDPDIVFSQVVHAANVLKTMLEKLNLKSFVKLTGGNGLHVHIPIEPLYTWREIKSFSRALALMMVEINPSLYVAVSTKKLRKGKIFIDYLRNLFGSTAVAPYSLRAREISSVAMPVSWSELSKIKSSKQFTLKKALLKIKNRKSDPWKNFFLIKQKIPLFH